MGVLGVLGWFAPKICSKNHLLSSVSFFHRFSFFVLQQRLTTIPNTAKNVVLYSCVWWEYLAKQVLWYLGNFSKKSTKNIYTARSLKTTDLKPCWREIFGQHRIKAKKIIHELRRMQAPKGLPSLLPVWGSFYVPKGINETRAHAEWETMLKIKLAEPNLTSIQFLRSWTFT